MLDIDVLQAQLCGMFNNRVTSDNSVTTPETIQKCRRTLLSQTLSLTSSTATFHRQLFLSELHWLTGLLVKIGFSATLLDSSSGLLLALGSLVSGSG